MKPWAKAGRRRGSWARSAGSMPWKNGCASGTRTRNSGWPCARGKADPSWSNSAGPWKSCAEGCCPKSLLGQAIDYTLARWAALIRYVDNGRLEINNEPLRNSGSTHFIGKKNFLFIGHPEAGQRSAVIYSVLGSCRRHGINPAEYLQDVFERLPKAKTSEVPALTPGGLGQSQTRRRPPGQLKPFPSSVLVPLIQGTSPSAYESPAQ